MHDQFGWRELSQAVAETDGLVIHICRDPNDIASVWPLLKKYYHGDQLGDPARELSDARASNRDREGAHSSPGSHTIGRTNEDPRVAGSTGAGVRFRDRGSEFGWAGMVRP